MTETLVVFLLNCIAYGAFAVNATILVVLGFVSASRQHDADRQRGATRNAN